MFSIFFHSFFRNFFQAYIFPFLTPKIDSLTPKTWVLHRNRAKVHILVFRSDSQMLADTQKLVAPGEESWRGAWYDVFEWFQPFFLHENIQKLQRSDPSKRAFGCLPAFGSHSIPKIMIFLHVVMWAFMSRILYISTSIWVLRTPNAGWNGHFW